MPKTKKSEYLPLIDQGGNARVRRIENGNVKKTLFRTNPESLNRFSAEIEIMRSAGYLGLSNIVKVVSYDTSSKEPWYSMREYTGNSNALVSHTRGNVKNTVSLMLPVVRSLKALSENTRPIFHRDLKPDNLLYDGTPDSPILMVADFGCAFMKTDREDRITEDCRAVGATFYRAPEYTYGRVQDITSAGDIFSIGKLLWFFLNGVVGEVFPYTLWFPPEYNLSVRFPAAARVHELNLVVARCVRYAPMERPTYSELIASLEAFLSEASPMANPDRLALLQLQEESRIKRDEMKRLASSLLSVFLEELRAAQDRLLQDFQGVEQVERLSQKRQLNATPEELVSHPVEGGSDAVIWGFGTQGMSFNARIVQVSQWNGYRSLGILKCPDAPMIVLSLVSETRTGERRQPHLIFHITDGQMHQAVSVSEKSEPATEPFRRGTIYEHLVSAINRMAQ